MIRVIILFICIGILSFLSVLFYTNFTDKTLTTIQKTYSVESFTLYKNGELMKGDIVAGQFRATENNLGILSIRFESFGRINNDIFIFRIKEEGNEGWYYENEYESSKFGGYSHFPFGFPIIADSKGKDFYFELESLQGKPGNAVALKQEEPSILTTHKFTVRQLTSDKRTMVFFLFQKAANLFASKLGLQKFLFVYITLVSIVAGVLIITTSRKRLARFVLSSMRQLKKKGIVVEKYLLQGGRVLRFLLKIITATGRITLHILSLFSKWLEKEMT